MTDSYVVIDQDKGIVEKTSTLEKKSDLCLTTLGNKLNLALDQYNAVATALGEPTKTLS